MMTGIIYISIYIYIHIYIYLFIYLFRHSIFHLGLVIEISSYGELLKKTFLKYILRCSDRFFI